LSPAATIKIAAVSIPTPSSASSSGAASRTSIASYVAREVYKHLRRD
jgi:hypothetical protein